MLEYLTIGWNVIETVVAVTAGITAGSIALVGFGFDSSIEVVEAPHRTAAKQPNPGGRLGGDLPLCMVVSHPPGRADSQRHGRLVVGRPGSGVRDRLAGHPGSVVGKELPTPSFYPFPGSAARRGTDHSPRRAAVVTGFSHPQEELHPDL